MCIVIIMCCVWCDFYVLSVGIVCGSVGCMAIVCGMTIMRCMLIMRCMIIKCTRNVISMCCMAV